jgi:hypothetical protein
MDKDKNKGLADTQEGEFILNESGTSVSVDPDVTYPEDQNQSLSEPEKGDTKDETASDEPG